MSFLGDLKKFICLNRPSRDALFIAAFYILKNAVWLHVMKRGPTDLIKKSAKRQLTPPFSMPANLGLHAIEELSRRLKPTPGCLVQALAVRDVLHRYGYTPEVKLLARTSEIAGYEFHAAVYMDGKFVYGEDKEWQSAKILRSV